MRKAFPVQTLAAAAALLAATAALWHLHPVGSETPAAVAEAGSAHAQHALIMKRPPWRTSEEWGDWPVQLCQALGPAAPCPVPAVECTREGCCDNARWRDRQMIGFQQYAQGEYVGPARTEHVTDYHLRVDDQLELIYRLTRDLQNHPYLINIGDEVKVESITDPTLNRTLVVQPDGTITLMLLGDVKAYGETVSELREQVEQLYTKYYKVPAITVTPVKINTKLEDLRATIDARAGIGGQRSNVVVTPEGTISLPAIGTVPAQGLSLRELKREIDERYAQEIEGIEVTPVLAKRAPRYVFVLGEVKNPGRYTLDGPTTIMQAIATAGSWNYGGDISKVIVFRRADDWRLQATKLDLKAALLGKNPCPSGEIWVSDSDVVMIPKTKLQWCDNNIDLIFTQGLYKIIPFSTNAGVQWAFFSGAGISR
jgi:polysaccharide export outer membrane protein